MKKLLISTFLFTSIALTAANSLPPHPTVQELKQELGLKVLDSKESLPENATKLYLVHHGSTEWSEIKRLQGWNNVPLSEKGKQEIQTLAEKIRLLGISSIYTSPSQSSEETSKILSKQLSVPVIALEDLKGEFHGQFEGLTRSEYLKHPHFQLYYFLPAEEEIFFPCGKGGESKADVGRRVIPALKKIATEHPGESVVVVLHEGVFKLLNFFAGKYKPEETISVPYGDVLEIAANANTLYLIMRTPFGA